MVHAAPARDRLQAYLRDHGVCFTLRHHPLAFTAHEVAAAEHISDERLAKAVVLVANRAPVVVVKCSTTAEPKTEQRRNLDGKRRQDGKSPDDERLRSSGVSGLAASLRSND